MTTVSSWAFETRKFRVLVDRCPQRSWLVDSELYDASVCCILFLSMATTAKSRGLQLRLGSVSGRPKGMRREGNVPPCSSLRPLRQGEGISVWLRYLYVPAATAISLVPGLEACCWQRCVAICAGTNGSIAVPSCRSMATSLFWWTSA